METSAVSGGQMRAYQMPILWITMVTGLKFDCFTALFTEYDDYCLVIEVDYRYMRDASLFHPGLNHRDREYEHHWLFLELMTAESAEPAAPAVETGSCVSPTMAKIDLGNAVFLGLRSVSPRRYGSPTAQ